MCFNKNTHEFEKLPNWHHRNLLLNDNHECSKGDKKEHPVMQGKNEKNAMMRVNEVRIPCLAGCVTTGMISDFVLGYMV